MEKEDLKLRKCEGFTFAEVMFALVIFTITIASLIPLFLFVMKEKQTVREQLIAYEILHNLFEEMRAKNEMPDVEQKMVKRGTIFEINIVQTDENIHICVEWIGKNEREYDECGVIKWKTD